MEGLDWPVEEGGAKGLLHKTKAPYAAASLSLSLFICLPPSVSLSLTCLHPQRSHIFLTVFCINSLHVCDVSDGCKVRVKREELTLFFFFLHSPLSHLKGQSVGLKPKQHYLQKSSSLVSNSVSVFSVKCVKYGVWSPQAEHIYTFCSPT